MYCKECGKQIDEDSKFCSFCGAKQTFIESNKVRSITILNHY
ncbi:MAG: zinc ribbon domain-containing protein [Salinivirgaceae bacterium]|nr:zinc ribbon domain-containing protein [Salinivirgaceae bacterium]